MPPDKHTLKPLNKGYKMDYFITGRKNVLFLIGVHSLNGGHIMLGQAVLVGGHLILWGTMNPRTRCPTRVFSEFTETITTSHILLEIILPEEYSFIIWFSYTAWIKMNSSLYRLWCAI